MPSSSPIHIASPIVVVQFPTVLDLDPLTTTLADLAADIGRYVQRKLSGPLEVSVREDEQCGSVRCDGRVVAVFAFRPLGPVAHVTETAVAA